MIAFFCVICGGLAVAASWSQDEIMNYIFGYANLILMVAFVSVGMSIIILQARVISDFSKECATSTGKAHQIDNMYKQGSQLLCTDLCPCSISDITMWDVDVAANLVTKPDGFSRLLDCPNEGISQKHESKYAVFLEALETEFDCAGICELPEFFMFSDVNKAEGPPQMLCKDAAISYVKNEGSKYSQLLMFAGIFAAIGVV